MSEHEFKQARAAIESLRRQLNSVLAGKDAQAYGCAPIWRRIDLKRHLRALLEGY